VTVIKRRESFIVINEIALMDIYDLSSWHRFSQSISDIHKTFRRPGNGTLHQQQPESRIDFNDTEIEFSSAFGTHVACHFSSW
jgi:hypothetical protein